MGLPEHFIDLAYEIPGAAVPLILPPKNIAQSFEDFLGGRIKFLPALIAVALGIQFESATVMIRTPKTQLVAFLLPPFVPRHTRSLCPSTQKSNFQISV